MLIVLYMCAVEFVKPANANGERERERERERDRERETERLSPFCSALGSQEILLLNKCP